MVAAQIVVLGALAGAAAWAAIKHWLQEDEDPIAINNSDDAHAAKKRTSVPPPQAQKEPKSSDQSQSSTKPRASDPPIASPFSNYQSQSQPLPSSSSSKPPPPPPPSLSKRNVLSSKTSPSPSPSPSLSLSGTGTGRQRPSSPKPPSSTIESYDQLGWSRNLSPSLSSKQTLVFPEPSSSFGTPLSAPKPPPLSTTKPDQKKTNCIHDDKGTPLSFSKPTASMSSKQSSPLVSLSSSSSSKPPSPSTKPTLSPAPSNLNNDQTKSSYIQVEKESSPLYVIPEDIKSLIEKDIVPGVLRKPLSPSTYKDYFAALLYAEDYYFEKWNDFEMKNVTLELEDAEIYTRKSKYKNVDKLDKKDDKVFVAFKMDSIPEKRPFLLSRDFAFVRPSGWEVVPFRGIIYRVVKRNFVLVDFGEDFHSQHYSSRKYDVSFSFNRVCLKRAHQAIASTSNSLFQNFLFPDGCVPRNSCTTPHFVSSDHKLDMDKATVVRQIISLKGPPPYLVDGPISRNAMVVKEAVLQIYRTFPKCRILICAPMNKTCDELMMSLLEDIPESDMFRANAAFRGLDEVPDDILPSCLYEGEFFSCPSLQKLKKYKVVFSTFMSSFRLHNEGIMAGHFTHIFLVDASSAIEPETIVPLANLAGERTALVITGTTGNSPRWVRSKIARQNGLMTSCFERLHRSKLDNSLDPNFITKLKDTLDDTYSFWDF